MLYVAVTRAKQTIHFLAGSLQKPEPYKSSSLSYLWPGVENDFEKQIRKDKVRKNDDNPSIFKQNLFGHRQ